MNRLSDFSCRRPQEDCPYLSIIRLISCRFSEEIKKEKSVSLKYQCFIRYCRLISVPWMSVSWPSEFFRRLPAQRQKTGQCMRVYIGRFIRLIEGILTSQCMSSSVSLADARIIHPVNRARHWLSKSRLLDQQTSNFHIHKVLGQNLGHLEYNPIHRQPSQK